jgi:prepilin-type processing-associated H-X9-DG protein
MRRPLARAGFSLIELLAIIGIIGVLIGLVVPAVFKVREQAARTQCQNNLHDLGMAAHGCDQLLKRLPPAWGKLNGEGTVLFALLPYTAYGTIYTQSGKNVNNTITLTDGKLQYASNFMIPMYLCPADESGPPEGLGKRGGIASDLEVGQWGFGNYGVNFQVFGSPDAGNNASLNMQGQAKLGGSFPDGLSTTILFAEKFRRCGDFGSLWGYGSWSVPWMALFAYGNRTGTQGYTSFSFPAGTVGPASRFQTQPQPWPSAYDPSRAASAHFGGINVCMADGSVRFLSNSIDGDLWWALCTPANGDQLTGDF